MTASALPITQTRPHVIQQLTFNVSFNSEQLAFDWQERLSDFMRGTGRTLIGKVFDEFAQGSSSDRTIALEQLDIDLGALNEADGVSIWYDRLANGLREALAEALAGQVVSPQSTRSIKPLHEIAWDALTAYLSSGHASWRTSVHTSSEHLVAYAATVLADQRAARLVAWLRALTKPQPVLKRLIALLTASQCADLLAALAPATARALGRTLAATDLQRRDWECILSSLLQVGPGADTDVMTQTAAIMAALPPTVRSAIEAAALPRKALAWQRLWQQLVTALRAEDDGRLMAIWAECLGFSVRRLRAATTALGQETEQRRRMAHLFSHAMLTQLVCLHRPEEGDFIAFVIGHTLRMAPQSTGGDQSSSSIVGHAANVDNVDRRTPLRIHLWEFTLTQLLVDRGTVFNRRSYAAGLLQATALHEGIDYLGLLQAMLFMLRSDALATGLRRQLLQLLADLLEVAVQDRSAIDAKLAQNTGESQAVARQTLRQRMNLALTAGDTATLQTLLPQLDAATMPWLPLEWRRLGQMPDVRQRLACDLPEHALAAIVDCLVPGEGLFIAAAIAFIAPVVGENSAVRKPPRQAGSLLWEFTLGYLTAERGSSFNRRTYMQSMLQAIAMTIAVPGGTTSYLALLDALRVSLGILPQPNRLYRQMALLVDELWSSASSGSSNDATAVESRTQAALRARIALALRQTDMHDWERLWRDWAPRAPQLLREELLRLTANATACQQLVSRLPLQWRGPLLHFLLPTESAFIAGVIKAGTAAAHVTDTLRTGSNKQLSQQKAHAALWEFSLLFALGTLGTQGGGFNRRAYAAFLLHKLAARDGFEYAVLLSRIAELLPYLPKATETDGIANLLRTLQAESVEKLESRATQGTKRHAESVGVSTTFNNTVKEIHNDTNDTPTVQPHSGGSDGDSRAPANPLAIASALQPCSSMSMHAMIAWLREPGRAAELAASLAVPQCAMLLHRLRPADYRAVLALAAQILARCHQQFPGVDGAWLEREQWCFIFRYFFEQERAFSETEFLRCLAAHYATHERLVANSAPAALLVRGTSADRLLRTTDIHNEAVFIQENTQQDTDPIYIANAGLVLLSPYLPPLFTELGLLGKQGFVSDVARARAIAISQTLVTGTVPTIEADLTLNKLLCGAAPNVALDSDIVFSVDELNLAEDLLRAVVAHWRALGSTSITGLRESFLQREGCLMHDERGSDGDWQLLVEARPFDMLLDRLPWGFSTVKYSWMTGMIRVEWR